MVRFIGAIIELHRGRSSIDTNAMKSIAEQVLHMCGKKTGDVVTEEEFIRSLVLYTSLLIFANLILHLVVNIVQKFRWPFYLTLKFLWMPNC